MRNVNKFFLLKFYSCKIESDNDINWRPFFPEAEIEYINTKEFYYDLL